MNAADRDLRCFQLARQLHLLPLLKEVFDTNSLVFPFFYGCLDPRAKDLTKQILLCLQRRLVPKIKDTGNGTHSLSTITTCILSFLSFPHLIPTRPRMSILLHRLSYAPPSSFHEPTKTASGNPIKTPSQSQRSPSQSALLPARTLQAAAPTDLEHTGATGSVSSSREETGIPTSKALDSNLVAGNVGKPSARDVLYQPMFHVRQPHSFSPESSTNHAIFIRMTHTLPLNEESLNPYFGRYGQISCALQRRVRLSEHANLFSNALVHSLLLAFQCDRDGLLIQDFIVSVDSYQNAVSAVHRAYYKELLFIAFHDTSHDTHCIADLDAMQSSIQVPYYARPSLAKELSAMPTAARRREKRRKPSRMPRAAAALKRASSTSTSSFSSFSSSSSSSLDGSFVPDVIVDGLPHWATESQLKVFLQEHGKVESIRMSVDDLSGAFTGAILVRMSTADEAIRLANAMHGTQFDSHTLKSGVLNERLEIRSLENADEIRCPCDEDLPASFAIDVNERAWV